MLLYFFFTTFTISFNELSCNRSEIHTIIGLCLAPALIGNESRLLYLYIVVFLCISIFSTSACWYKKQRIILTFWIVGGFVIVFWVFFWIFFVVVFLVYFSFDLFCFCGFFWGGVCVLVGEGERELLTGERRLSTPGSQVRRRYPLRSGKPRWWRQNTVWSSSWLCHT